MQRIANYFQHNYEGIDETAPKFEITVEELREIAAINTEINQKGIKALQP